MLALQVASLTKQMSGIKKNFQKYTFCEHGCSYLLFRGWNDARSEQVVKRISRLFSSPPPTPASRHCANLRGGQTYWRSISATDQIGRRADLPPILTFSRSSKKKSSFLFCNRRDVFSAPYFSPLDLLESQPSTAEQQRQPQPATIWSRRLPINGDRLPQPYPARKKKRKAGTVAGTQLLNTTPLGCALKDE